MIDDYATRAIKTARKSCTHSRRWICRSCILDMVRAAYEQGCADQKRAALARVGLVPESIIGTVSKHSVLQAVVKAEPIAEGEKEKM